MGVSGVDREMNRQKGALSAVNQLDGMQEAESAGGCAFDTSQPHAQQAAGQSGSACNSQTDETRETRETKRWGGAIWRQMGRCIDKWMDERRL